MYVQLFNYYLIWAMWTLSNWIWTYVQLSDWISDVQLHELDIQYSLTSKVTLYDSGMEMKPISGTYKFTVIDYVENGNVKTSLNEHKCNDICMRILSCICAISTILDLTNADNNNDEIIRIDVLLEIVT
uniref:Uncharacterized protein n=1 Tax=Rhizophagus irregularis (strain DAOM 181602 / DAOM 197198 / MUCL 43194) TaxID=747089 RepID=U9SQL9_RHIID